MRRLALVLLLLAALASPRPAAAEYPERSLTILTGYPAGGMVDIVGAYSLNNSQLDLWVLVVFGIFGYALRKLAIDPSPLVVALVLGPLMEKTLRQALFMARGDLLEIVGRPLTLALLLVGVGALVGPPLLRRVLGVLTATRASRATP